MPLTRNDSAPGSHAWAIPLSYTLVAYPASDTDLYIRNQDPHLVTVGDDIVDLIGSKPTPPCTGFTMQVIDSSGSTTTITVDVAGQNQFGEEVSETLTIATGAGTKYAQTVHAYRVVDTMIVTAIAGFDAVGDELNVGFLADSTTNRLVIGVPVKLRTAGGLLAASKFGAPATAGTRRAVAGVNLTRHTFFLLSPSGITGGETLQLRFATDELI